MHNWVKSDDFSLHNEQKKNEEEKKGRLMQKETADRSSLMHPRNDSFFSCKKADRFSLIPAKHAQTYKLKTLCLDNIGTDNIFCWNPTPCKKNFHSNYTIKMDKI